jgi:hypothetical protein
MLVEKPETRTKAIAQAMMKKNRCSDLPLVVAVNCVAMEPPLDCAASF